MAAPFNSTAPCVLLTGANGFTGRYITQELKLAGYSTIGLVNNETTNPGELSANLHSIEQLRSVLMQTKPDYIIHLAAISAVQYTALAEFYQTNVIGTCNLLQAILDTHCQPKKIIIASSGNVYGNQPISPITEETPPQPINHYACSKLAMEHMVKTYFTQLPILITRPFNYTGVGQPDYVLIPKIVQHFRLNKPEIELGNIDIIRDFSDVRTVAHIYRLLLESNIKSTTLNICAGKGYSLLEILKYMATLAKYEIKIKVNPLFVRANEVHQLIGANDLLIKVIGRYTTYDLPDTLKWMYHAS